MKAKAGIALHITIWKGRVYLQTISLESPQPFQAKIICNQHSLLICEEISVISLIVFKKRHTIHIGALWINPTILVSLCISWENNTKSNNLCRFVKKFQSYLL